jgi:predicted dehydrogenase
MKKLKHIRWGIIGCGDVTEVKSGPAFSKANNSSLVAVMRRNADKARDYAIRHGVPKWYNDASELINDPDVDAVYVATPPESHAYYTKKIIESGKPVYVEKPMAHSYQECLEMINIAEKHNIPLYVAYYRRMLPYFIKVKELLDSHAIGEPRTFFINLFLPPRKEDHDRMNPPWRVKSNIAGAGYFYDMGAHQIDLIDFFFGPIAWTKGVSKNQAGLYEVEDMVAAIFGYDNGLTGTGQWIFTTHTSAKTDLFEIIGSEGKISFSSFEFTPIILKNARGEQWFDLKPPIHIQEPLIQSVVQELISDKFFPGNCTEAARTSKIMDIILRRYIEESL